MIMRPLNPKKRPTYPWMWLATVDQLRVGEPIQSADIRDHKALYDSASQKWLGVDESGILKVAGVQLQMDSGVWYVKHDGNQQPITHPKVEFRNLP